ncbi:SLAP domain-containing protein [Lactobacillus sp. ESL0681]|uniref:SLAP domain-containing protein n=1 Tax=Lactobacillus sp. ESL0681 TaxID=2983211 RepID=UPI0023F846EF|nr:SLAP domain-containing protein [Lactobacillus sp. ESL0681]WEV41033.1 SLAP domain-containing protein [Lactobacillus sp. ESL0681]
MKNRKLVLLLTAVSLAAAPTTMLLNCSASVQAAATTVKLGLNHKTRVYNKKGQKLWYYQGSSALISSKKTVKAAKKIKSITDPYSKQYSFHDNEWNWFYLPYKVIKGQEYYSIGHGGYIKAANVDTVNKQELMTNRVTIKLTKKMLDEKNTIKVYDATSDQKQPVHFKLGQKVTFDAQVDGNNDWGTFRTDSGTYYLLRIKGTDKYFVEEYDEDGDSLTPTYTTKNLLPYAKYEQVAVIANTPLYNENGELAKEHTNHGQRKVTLKKGNSTYGVTKELYLRLPGQSKAELFYQFQDGWATWDAYNLVKAADVKYAYGPRLQIVNTEADAMSGKALATDANRAELKALLDEAPKVRASERYSYSQFEVYYDSAITEGQRVYDALISSDTEIKAAIANLQGADQTLNDGKRVPVKDLQHITDDEAEKIVTLADHASYLKYPKTNNFQNRQVKFNDDKTELDLFITDSSSKPATMKKYKLDVNDYVTKEN